MKLNPEGRTWDKEQNGEQIYEWVYKRIDMKQQQ